MVLVGCAALTASCKQAPVAQMEEDYTEEEFQALIDHAVGDTDYEHTSLGNHISSYRAVNSS